jgi:flavin-dependent dehydrogenase
MRVGADDEHFRIGNAAGEAHPILGEGISMALQSAALLCSHLLKASPAALSSRAADHAELHRSYARDWARHFRPRLRLAAVFAHGAMHPRSAAWLVRMARAWPGLLTNGARWGGKVQSSAHDTSAPQGMASPVGPAPAHLAADFGTPGRKERHERHL